MRNTAKNFSKTIVTVQYINAEGDIAEGMIELNGRKSENAALIAAQKQFGNNCFVESIEYTGTSLKLSADTFYSNSAPCVEGTSYGHDTVVQAFKETLIDVRYRGEDGITDTVLIYFGTTTDRKARNFACETLNTKNVLVRSTKVVERKRWMLKSTYEELAQAEADAQE